MTTSLSQTALHDLSVQQLATALATKQVSAVEAAQHFLNRSAAHAALGAYVDVNPEVTLAQAAARVEALRGEWVQSGLYPNPRVGYQGLEIGDDGRAGQCHAHPPEHQ